MQLYIDQTTYSSLLGGEICGECHAKYLRDDHFFYILRADFWTAAFFIGQARGRSHARDKQRSKGTHFLQDLNVVRRRTKSYETLIWASSQFLCGNVHRANWVFAWAYDSLSGFYVTVFHTIITDACHAFRDGLPLGKRKISKFWERQKEREK